MNEHGWRPSQHSDRLPGRLLAGVGAALAIVTVLSTVGVWVVLRAFERAERPSGLFPERDATSPPAIEGLERTLVGSAARPGGGSVDPRRARLDRYGWVDRGARVVHLPIHRAIDVVVEEERTPR